MMLFLQKFLRLRMRSFNNVPRYLGTIFARGLPPEREIDHEITTEQSAKPPHRALFKPSPSELLATKNYITDLLKNGKSDQAVLHTEFPSFS